ncbi:MAG: AMP-binding protein [Clostridiales bacterium]|nr:AMP-binding protein [Candidatus Scatonaster coprocaballi]
MPRNTKKNYPYHQVHYVRDLRDLLNRRCEMYPDSPVFRYRDRSDNTRSWKDIYPVEFRNDVQQLGAGLLSLWEEHASSSQKENLPKIAILSETRYEWYVSYMATVSGLGVVVPIDRMMRAEELATMFQRAGINIVLFSRHYAETILQIMPECQDLLLPVCFDEYADDQVYNYKDVCHINSDVHAYAQRPINPDDVGILLFTSGTTSKSKIVMLSQRNICSDIMNMFKMCEFSPEDSFLSVLPLHHTYECTCGFLAQIYKGTTIYIGEGLTKITTDLKEAQPTCLCAVPALLEKFYEKIMKELSKSKLKKLGFTMLRAISKILYFFRIDARKKFFSTVNAAFGGNLRLVFLGGAPSDPKILQFFDEIGIEVLQGYGLTECAPLVAVNRERYYRYNSAGLPLVGNEIKVDQPDENGIGELLIKGDNVFLGYYGNPQATKDVFDDEGYFHSGDVGYIDQEGFIYITGRKKNVIIAKNGKNVFPEELEYLLNRSPLVCESVVSQRENEAGNDYIIQAEIFPDFEYIEEHYGNQTPEELQQMLDAYVTSVNHQLESFQRIKKVILRDTEFEKSSTHKINRCA